MTPSTPWTPESWRQRPIRQAPTYPDATALDAVDALFFLLYGLDRDTADYVLSTFPIVQREECPIRRPFPLPRRIIGSWANDGTVSAADTRTCLRQLCRWG